MKREEWTIHNRKDKAIYLDYFYELGWFIM